MSIISNYIIKLFSSIFLNIIIFPFNSYQNIIVFNSSNWRAGHSAFTSNGDLIIEYSYKNTRLFYGLKYNGNNYFNNSQTKSLIIGENGNERYESKNIFIKLNNEDKEYLFSIGTSTSGYPTITELIDLDTNEMKTMNTYDLLESYLYSYTFSLYAVNNYYFLTFLTGSTCRMSYLSFYNFNIDGNIFYASAQEGRITTNSRIVNSFRMNDYIILFYLIYPSYNLNIYDLELKEIEREIYIDNAGYLEGQGVFFKGLHLKNDLMALIYFYSTQRIALRISIGYINNFNDPENDPNFVTQLSYNFNNYQFYYDDPLNDFVN